MKIEITGFGAFEQLCEIIDQRDEAFRGAELSRPFLSHLEGELFWVSDALEGFLGSAHANATRARQGLRLYRDVLIQARDKLTHRDATFEDVLAMIGSHSGTESLANKVLAGKINHQEFYSVLDRIVTVIYSHATESRQRLAARLAREEQASNPNWGSW